MPAARAGSVAASHSRPSSTRKSARRTRSARRPRSASRRRGRRRSPSPRPRPARAGGRWRPRQGLGQEPGSADPALADAPLPLGGPARADVLAREMDHRVESLEGGGVDRAGGRVPVDRVPTACACRVTGVTRWPPVVRNGISADPEQAARAGDRDVQRALVRKRAWAARSSRSVEWRYASIRSVRGRASHMPAAAPRVPKGGRTRSGRCSATPRAPPARRDAGGPSGRTVPRPARPRTGVPDVVPMHGDPSERHRAGVDPERGARAVFDARRCAPPPRSAPREAVRRSNAPGRSCQANASSAEAGRVLVRSISGKAMPSRAFSLDCRPMHRPTLAGLLIGGLALHSCGSAPPARLAARRASCVVERVADGDTFTCRDGRRVRLLGMDTSGARAGRAGAPGARGAAPSPSPGHDGPAGAGCRAARPLRARAGLRLDRLAPGEREPGARGLGDALHPAAEREVCRAAGAGAKRGPCGAARASGRAAGSSAAPLALPPVGSARSAP